MKKVIEKKKLRRCLICDKKFYSTKNRICPKCHKKYEFRFEEYSFGANFEGFIYHSLLGEDDFEISEKRAKKKKRGEG